MTTNDIGKDVLVGTVLVAAALMVGVALGDDATPAKLRSGTTEWGDLAVERESITITGHKTWSASGTMLKNGEIHLFWVMESGDRANGNRESKHAYGVYRYTGGSLVGRWGWILGPVDATETIEVIPPPLR